MIICNCEECIFCKDKACIIEVGDIAITIDKNGSCFNKVIPDKVCKSAKSNIKEDPCKKCALSKYTCTGCEERINYEKKKKKEK